MFIQQTAVDTYKMPIRALGFVAPPLWKQNIKSITATYEDSHHFPFASFPQLEHLHIEHHSTDRTWRSLPSAAQVRLGGTKLDSELSQYTADRLRAEMLQTHVDREFGAGSKAARATADEVREVMAGIKTLITWYIYREDWGTVRLNPTSGEIYSMTTSPSFKRVKTRVKLRKSSSCMPWETVGWLGLPPPLGETRLKRIDFDHPSYPNFCHGLAFTEPPQSKATVVPARVEEAVSEIENGGPAKKRKLG
jgi:hypothetical protein